MKLDLSSFASVREFATAFAARNQCVDILLNNAGMLLPTHQ
jgi:NAD(P)-dependent dehydrogenase (short-subunit alcohol dehydrogenase family)